MNKRCSEFSTPAVIVYCGLVLFYFADPALGHACGPAFFRGPGCSEWIQSNLNLLTFIYGLNIILIVAAAGGYCAVSLLVILWKRVTDGYSSKERKNYFIGLLIFIVLLATCTIGGYLNIPAFYQETSSDVDAFCRAEQSKDALMHVAPLVCFLLPMLVFILVGQRIFPIFRKQTYDTWSRRICFGAMAAFVFISTSSYFLNYYLYRQLDPKREVCCVDAFGCG